MYVTRETAEDLFVPSAGDLPPSLHQVCAGICQQPTLHPTSQEDVWKEARDSGSRTGMTATWLTWPWKVWQMSQKAMTIMFHPFPLQTQDDMNKPCI